MKKAVTLSALGLAGVAIVVAAAVFRFGPDKAVSATALPSASGAASGKPAAEVVLANGVKVKGKPVALKTTAVGTLVANESVEIASELSRRVVKVYAKDGVRAKKGEVLFKLDDADLAAQLAELSVKKKLAADVEARQKKLRAEGLSTEADYERARTDLELVGAQIASLGVTISRTSIRAPFDGRLGLRAVSEGAMVTPQTTLVTLQDDASLKVDFTLPERYGPLVKQGAAFSFRVEGQPDLVEAKVVAVEPQVDSETRSVRVRGLTDNTAGKLMPGSFVNVEFPLSQETGGLLVPTEAVVPSLGGHGVYRLTDGKAELVVVELGVRMPAEVQITRGLAEGDVVLTSNILRLRPGIPVKLGTVD
ncbi:MAG: efflux RND transporter periplasmic adaptor subunit [Polyangiaceae bacterium]|nr:efflux RND transporter periplasmic adaptor subunit [Polyangiaceae bacterium]